MKKKKKHHHHHHHYSGAPKSKAEISVLSDSLAPPEERDAKPATNAQADNKGAIVLDTGALNLPQGLSGKEREEQGQLFGLDRVVIVILIGMLSFIAFIAYLIYLMPAATAQP
jgi:hypothetical protein